MVADLTSHLMTKNESIHEVLYSLNVPFEECPKCVRLFSEQQPAVPVNMDVLEEIEKYYGGQKGASAFAETGFSGDDDGLASITRINSEVEMCTGKLLNSVVREENGPNRRAQMVLVSAVDCTFYWKFEGQREPLMKCPFYKSSGKEADGMSSFYVWPCQGDFRHLNTSTEQLLELESHVEGFKLYLYKCNLDELTAVAFFQAVDSLPAAKSPLKVCVPRVFVMCPLRLSECTNTKHEYGLRRIFDREKSDLSGIFYRSHSFYPYFVTLWEHYHKAKFAIYPTKPKPAENMANVKLAGCRLGVAVEHRVLKQRLYKKIPPNRCVRANPYKYYECKETDLLPEAEAKQGTPPDDSYMKFDTPFFFMVIKEGPFGRMIHCIGRFNNVAATYVGTQPPPAFEV
ncbi:hypothetical protein Y032_0054g2527 [Ancylostoma ceylanicum]|uniref:Serpin domain-containing protein n=1 Tax=Ancylostoma ceylanicum TaxID=53326 RepID=A0A016U6E5_9BILA|nr:hypothetical protein Y032_0054g2527 [Ancylostoma ceylanicum]